MVPGAFPKGSSLNILMVEIGKILGGIGDKSGKIYKTSRKTDFEHPLDTKTKNTIVILTAIDFNYDFNCF